MKKLVFLLVFVFCAVNCQAAQEGKAYFEDMLNKIGALNSGNYKRPYPNLMDSSNIIGTGIYLAYFDSADYLEKYNRPLHSMGINGDLIIPEKFVNMAVCKYYDYTVSKHDTLTNAAEKEQFSEGYYFLKQEGDSNPVDFKIDEVFLQKNGLLCAIGTERNEPFKAFFKKATCGGKPHWVLLSIYYTDLEEEKDDFRELEDE